MEAYVSGSFVRLCVHAFGWSHSPTTHTHLMALFRDYPGDPTTLFLQAGCPSCHPTNSVKALKVYQTLKV